MNQPTAVIKIILIGGLAGVGETVAKALRGNDRFRLHYCALDPAWGKVVVDGLNLISIDANFEQKLNQVKEEEKNLIAIECLGYHGVLLCRLGLPFISIHPKESETKAIQEAAKRKVTAAILPSGCTANENDFIDCLTYLLEEVDRKRSSGNSSELACFFPLRHS